MDAAAKEADDTINQLNQRRKEMAMGTEEQRANLGLIDAEIERIRKLTRTYIEGLPEVIGGIQGVRMVEKARLADIENLIKALEQQAAIEQGLASTRLSIISLGQDTAFQKSLIGKGDLQKQKMEIVESNRKAGLEASRAFASTFTVSEDGIMTQEQSQKLAAGLKAIEEGFAGISTQQLANLELTKTWSAGLEAAFANYKDNAENYSKQAGDAFQTFTTGVEDAFANMFKSGDVSFKNLKKGFKDLANSMIADFIRIQAQKALVGIFGSIFGGGSTAMAGAAVLGLPGYASGGNIPAGQLSIVGERGPELFMPKNAGTIIPNNALGGGQTNNTAVTYNIQAVDASSFRSMLARDPEFIHNVAEQGRRQLPIRSRR
jgi:lambda family phage tail tape measure protein